MPAALAGTMTLAQALGDAGLDGPLWALTRGAVSTGPADPLTDPAQSQVWGLGRVVALEHPQLWGGLADLPATWDEPAADLLAALLADGTEDQVAIRPAGALGRRLLRAPLDAAEPDSWQPSGTVLVTGGTGALGARVARWLADRGAPHLLLTSRRGPAAPGAGELVADLAERGTRATVVACDVSDRDALSGLLATIPADQPMTAVIHAAGIVDDGVLDALTPERLAGVLRAKAVSAALLDELTDGLDLDAFVLFSSFAGVLGNPGQANYAAANAFLDGLAEQRRARGLAATSVAWGPWAGSGMADDVAAAGVHRAGVAPLDPELALVALARAIDHRDTCVAVADLDWAALAPELNALRPTPLLDALPEAQPPAVAAADGEATATPDRGKALREELAAMSEGEREQRVLDLVGEQIALVLDHRSAAEVDADRPFRALGLTSLAAVELRNALSAATGLALPASLVFDHPTPTAVAALIRTELTQEPEHPQNGSPSDRLDRLDRLEAALANLAPGGEEATAIADRLRQLASKLHGAGSGTDAGNDGSLAVATADDLFEIIQNEFGKS
jgi:NAD(P)-dependent dehydrogenase (short-subunit alcohol dehydrogenase family)/acyl carrier protein